eukprot:5639214-Pleurochrysis_carterae.AAC.3
MGMGERKRKSLTAPAMHAREVVATAYGHRPSRLLNTSLSLLSIDKCSILSSDRHVLRHVVNCRFSARGNLYRDLHLAARHPAVLAHAQPSGY